MIFLKNFYAEGFKSFAKPVNLNFSNTMIGIVGPNGSGKSNIVDAFKWAMGEQSVKSLRGKEKSNLIFAGSNDMPEADFALVELTFDNTNKILNHPSPEVKISRKLIRKTNESIFMINDEPARLRDVLDIFLDSGLTKGSLGIISQGTVNWFAEAKPEDRRHMFEEAAGIGRYTKQKTETLHSLDKVSADLERLDQHEASLKKEVRDLNRQAEKVSQYNEKINQLKYLECSMGVQDYLSSTAELKQLEQKEITARNAIENLRITSDHNYQLKNDANLEFEKYNKKVTELLTEKDNLSKKINDLQVKKITYQSNLETGIHSTNLEERKRSYLSLIASDEQELKSLKKQYEASSEKLTIVKKDLEKIEIDCKNTNIEYQEIQTKYTTSKTKFEALNETFKNSNNTERGVATLLKSKDSLGGIHSTVGNLIKVPNRYEVAIQTALGKSVHNIIVDTSKDAIKCINFLKKNNSGRATFQPLDVIKPKEIKNDSLIIMSKLPGFIDVASNLVNYDEKYQNVIKSLLGNVAIADDISNAETISKMVNNNYKVISLDGDIVYSGGALSGGQQQRITPAFNLEEKLENAKKELDQITEEYQKIKLDNDKLSLNLKKIQIEHQNLLSQIPVLEQKISESESRILKNKSGYEAIASSSDPKKMKTEIQQFEKEFIELSEQFSQLENELATTNDLKNHSYDTFAKYNMDYESSQKELLALQDKHNKLTNKLQNLHFTIDTVETLITNTYKMTMEMAIAEYSKPIDMTTNEARSVISKLKSEVDGLGPINFEAIDHLKEKEEELKKIEVEHKAVRESVINLKNILDDLDKRAKEDYARVIDKVNEIIPGIFTNLFGGGICKIKYTDPNNILESGIDVIVQPLGKKVSNLVLLSGGEKTLVALTVLFALLKSSSSFPLVVLDEAEAALDQSNVSSFAKLIHDFSNSTQFLVITHRTGTMKMCDVLYGTTMQIKGVTKVIKTDLEEIKKKLMKK